MAQAQLDVPKAGDVSGGLALAVDLVLEDQGLRQVEGQLEGGSGLIGATQEGLGPIAVSFPRLQADQAQENGDVLGMEPATRLVMGPRRDHVLVPFAGGGRIQHPVADHPGASRRATARSCRISRDGPNSRAYRQR